MGIVIDIIIVVVCAIIIFRGARSGLIKSALGLVRGIASFVVAYAFTPTVSDFIYRNFMLERISSGIRETIASVSITGDGTYNLSELFANMPDALTQIIGRYHVDADELTQMCKNVSDGSADTVSEVANFIAQPVADMLSGTVAFLGILIASLIVFSIVMRLLDIVFRLPGLKGTNRLLGLVFGVATALLFAVVFSSIASSIITGLGSVDSELFGEQAVQSSHVMKFFSSVNLFGLISGISVK